MDISVYDLNKVFEKLISHLQKKGIDTVHIKEDYYWDIPTGELYDPYNKPDNLNLGQLTDNWQDLKKVINGDNDPIMTDFIDLATVLRAIGEQGE